MARRPDPIDIAAQQREREQAEVEEAFIKGLLFSRFRPLIGVIISNCGFC